MAIESLLGVEKLAGQNVINMDDLRTKHPEKFNDSGGMDYKWFEAEIRPKNFIYVRHDVNSIAFTLQNGPARKKGVNGCQVDALIECAKVMIEHLNKKFPCRENAVVITKLDEALMWLERRTKDRVARGVEGTEHA